MATRPAFLLFALFPTYRTKRNRGKPNRGKERRKEKKRKKMKHLNHRWAFTECFWLLSQLTPHQRHQRRHERNTARKPSKCSLAMAGYSFIHPFIHSSIHPFIHSLIHSSPGWPRPKAKKSTRHTSRQWLHCIALPCIALPCIALPCIALPCHSYE